MPIDPLNRLAAKIVTKLPLRTVLIVPFVLQTAAAVGLVGYLSFKNGESAVENLAHHLIAQVAERICDRLTTYLQTPQNIVAANRLAVEQRMLNLNNTQQMRQQLWEQTILHPTLQSTTFVNDRGEEIGYGRVVSQELLAQVKRLAGEELPIGTPLMSRSESSDAGQRKYYLVDSKGNPRKLIYTFKIDNRTTPWYRHAKASAKQTWSPIQVFKVAPIVGIFALNPIRDAGKWRGVFYSNYALSAIGTFLEKLKFSPSGLTFIVDRSGNLVATSTLETLFVKPTKGEPRPLPAANSQDARTRDIVRQLAKKFGSFGNLQTPQQFTLTSDRTKQFVRVSRHRDRYGLDLSIVVVVPESDFTAQIEVNKRQTALFCLATLALAIACGLLTARWIAKPIRRLNAAVKDLARGEWDKKVEIERFDEVRELATSFNTMAAQLQESMAAQKSLNAALAQRENQLKQFIEAIPVGVVIHDVTGKVIYLNQASRELLGLETLPSAETDQLATAYQAYLAGTEQLYPVENMPAIRSLKGEKVRVDDMEIRQPERRVPIEVHSTPLLDDTGNNIGAIAAFCDITDRKQADKILADYNRSLEAEVTARTTALANTNKQLQREIADRELVEGMLYSSTQQVNTIFESITDVVLIVDDQERLEIIPTKATNLYTKDVNQFYLIVLEMFHHGSKEIWSAKVQEALTTQKTVNFDYNLRIDNQEVWFSAKISPLPNGSVVWVARDISDRKQIEEKLQSSEARLDTIVSNTSDGIAIVDGEGRISFANPAVAELFNLPVSELLGYDWGVPGQETSEISLIDGEGKIRTAEIKSTQTQWLGELAYIVALRDITDRKQSEQEIRQLSTALENAVEGISWLDKQGRYVTVNKAYASLTGYQPEEMIRMDWKYTVHPDDCPKMIAAYEEMLEVGKVEAEARGQRKDGSIFYKQLFMISAYDDRDNFTGHYCFMKDISDRKQAELALQQSQHRYQTLAESSPVCIFRTDPNGNFLYVNQRWSDLTGLYEAEAIHSGWSKTLHPEDRSRVLAEWYQTAALKETFKSEYRFLHPDGKVIWVIGQALPEIDNNGEIIGYIGTITDISDRKLAEAALHESAQREQALARTIERMHKSLDIATIFHTTTAELQQTLKCDRVIIYRFNPDWSGELVAESVADGWTPLMSQQSPQQLTDINLPNNLIADSGCQLTRLQSSPLPLLDTYIKETQGGAYSQGDMYRIAEDIYSAGFTPCYLEFLEQFQARSYLIVPIFCGKQLWGLLASYQNSGPRTWREAETYIALQISTQLGVALQQAQLLEATQKQSVQLQQAALAAEAANRAKSTFIANMSHELRTPLNAILGFSQLMHHSTNLNPQEQENIRIVNRSGEHLLSLINQILDLAKIEAGRITLDAADFDLRNLLLEIEEMFQLQAAEKNLSLIVDCDPTLPQYARTDAVKLRQVLINLLSNAVKFTFIGGISLKVKRINSSPKNQQITNNSQQPTVNSQQPQVNSQHITVSFEVKDTGMGIADDELTKLFQPFVQTQSGESAQQGSGLGLAISQQFVNLLGGAIALSSQIGCGTSFLFEIPVTAVDAAAIKPKQPLRQVIALEPNQPRYRILIVDDREDNRQLLHRMLGRFEFELAEASNGMEAIEMWGSFEPHLIFMDLRMPVMDGYEATKRIKAHTKGQATAIVAVTGSNVEAAGTVMLSTGCDDLIRKPFKEAEILDTLHDHLGVRYIYDRQESVSDSTQIEELTKEALADLPAEWVASLVQATVQCDLELILSQIEQIRPQDESVANGLVALANDFQFNQILALIQPKVGSDDEES